MRVLLINTSERTGGAAIAANRLMEALKNNGVKATMLVRDKQTNQITVASTGSKWLMALRFLWERLLIFFAVGFKKKDIWQVDLGNVGTDITHTDEFKQADVIHLHWVNQAFLSLNDLKKILKSGKRVVVTLHDMWHFTGICHYAGNCEKYRSSCEDCPLLCRKVLGIDYAKRAFQKKSKLYADARITFVGCSQWMKNKADEAALTRMHKVVSIPNAINTSLFAPLDQQETRRQLGLPFERKLILFSAQRITDERKGFSLLVEACNHLLSDYPSLAHQTTVVVVGSDSSTVKNLLPLDVVTIDYMSDE